MSQEPVALANLHSRITMRLGCAMTLLSHCSLFTLAVDGTLLRRLSGAGGAFYGETRQREVLTDLWESQRLG